MHGNNLFQQGVISVAPVCLLRADHPIQGHMLTLKQFLELEHVLAEGGGGIISVDHILGQRGLSRKVVLFTRGFSALPSIIENSDLVAVVSLSLGTHFVATWPNLKLMTPPLNFPYAHVTQYWHRKFHDDPKNKWLRGIIKGIFVEEQKTWLFPAEYSSRIRNFTSTRKVTKGRDTRRGGGSRI